MQVTGWGAVLRVGPAASTNTSSDFDDVARDAVDAGTADCHDSVTLKR